MQETKTLKTKIHHSDITDKIHDVFTLTKKEYHTFEPHHIQESLLPDDYSIGLIIGESGSGKTLLLQDFGVPKDISWDHRAIASHFESYEDARDRLLGSSLNSIPMWLTPYNILSNGEKYRANLARTVDDNQVIDEFCSVIDSNTGKSLCNSVQKYIRQNDMKGVVFAGVNDYLQEYLKPCWTYNTSTKTLTINSEFYEPQTHYFDKKYLKKDQEQKVHFLSYKS